MSPYRCKNNKCVKINDILTWEKFFMSPYRCKNNPYRCKNV